MGSLLADGVGLVDIINASDLKIMRAFFSSGKGDESEEGQELHVIFVDRFIYYYHVTMINSIYRSKSQGLNM